MMGNDLSQVIATARTGDSVTFSLTTNEGDGIAAFADGSLIFTASSGGQVFGGPRFRPATLSTPGSSKLRMYFSDRPADGGQPRQPFSAKATEEMGVSLSAGFGGRPVLTVQLFGNTSQIPMAPMANLLVGSGPQFGKSPEAVWVLALGAVIRAPG
jgi:hypothetical protein